MRPHRIARAAAPLLASALLAGSALLAPALTPPAAAHHGWAWTTGENMQLTGTITQLRLGNPHGELTLEVDGVAWTVEVGQPWRNTRSGLAEGDLAPGVQLRVEGEPAADPDRRLLKAERLWLGDTLHDLYPGRD